MGQHAARITAADFVTTPEFKHLRLAKEETGRIGGVRLNLAASGKSSQLQNCYQQTPLRAMSLDLGSSFPELVYLINPTAGLLDGDAHLIQIDAGLGTNTLVVGQSANRIHPAVQNFCTQQWHVTVQSGATLVILPGPTIPFRASRCYNRAIVDLYDGSHLIWGEVWMPGRHGELFCFERLIQEFVVRREGRLVYRNRFCWDGPWNEQVANWHFSGHPCCGSLFVTGPLSPALIPSSANIGMAKFETAANDTVVAWCGSADAVITNMVQLAEVVSSRLMDSDDASHSEAWANHLTRTHWFMPFSSSS